MGGANLREQPRKQQHSASARSVTLIQKISTIFFINGFVGGLQAGHREQLFSA